MTVTRQMLVLDDSSLSANAATSRIREPVGGTSSASKRIEETYIQLDMSGSTFDGRSATSDGGEKCGRDA